MKTLNMKKLTTFALAAMISLTTLFTPVTAKAAVTEVPVASLGIDVSRYQGLIDWAQVAASGVQFAMIRVGYRLETTGLINEDPYARYNLQEATKYGIKVGAYFFSTAITAEEAYEEALFTANICDQYAISYPVVYDCEGYKNKGSRLYSLNKEVRSALATIFLDTIAARGYTPMIYASKNDMENDKYWDMTTLAGKYKVWVAWYPKDPFPVTPACTYTGPYHIWQFSDKMTIPGIAGTVDMNVALFDYVGDVSPKNPDGAPVISASQASNVSYTPTCDVVTAKQKTNIRTEASTDRQDTIVATIEKGQMLFRAGIGNNGWSQVTFPNSAEVYYAYSQYLSKVQQQEVK